MPEREYTVSVLFQNAIPQSWDARLYRGTVSQKICEQMIATHHAMDGMFASPPDSYAEALTPMWWFGEVIRFVRGRGVEPPWWGWCPKKGMKGSELPFSPPCEDTARRQPSVNLE